MSEKRPPHETQRHLAAFELYVAQGGRRSYRAVAEATGVTVMAIRYWARSFDWQTRVRRRDAGIARKLARRTDESIVQVKARYHAMINKKRSWRQASTMYTAPIPIFHRAGMTF